MVRQRALLLLCLIGIVAGCNTETVSVGAIPGDGSSSALSAAGCQLSPDTLDFGRVVTPEFDWKTDYETLTFTIVNTGDSLLTGEVTITVEPEGPRRATFALTPPDTDSAFSLQPGDSATFTIGVTMENASHGIYTGTVDLGTGCDSIPLFLNAVPSQ